MQKIKLSAGWLVAGLDVFDPEPLEKDSPLRRLPNAFITPHIAWATREARLRMMDIVARNIEAFLGGNPQNVVT